MRHQTSKCMVQSAYIRKKAVAAINVSNMETITAVLKAADKLDMPVLLQVSPLQRQVQGFSYTTIVNMIHSIAQEYAHGAYAIHLDHALQMEECRRALEAGFDSVMLDGAALPLRENARTVSAVRRFCTAGALEGEVGVVGGGEANSAALKMVHTDPQEAAWFAAETGVDWLAVAIGNAHGAYARKPQLDFGVLKKIHEAVDIPLVLHGASGIPDEDIRKAIQNGVAKINFFTQLDTAFQAGWNDAAADHAYMMVLARAAQDRMQEKAEEILTLCASA